MTERGRGLQRPKNPMRGFVRDALEKRGLMDAYRSRPPYQRNDYLGWISRPKQDATRQRRLAQMLDELEDGGLYMKMAWRPRSGCPPSANEEQSHAARQQRE